MNNMLILRESELVQLIKSTVKDTQRIVQEQTMENIPLGAGGRGWTYYKGATYYWSGARRGWIVSFLGGRAIVNQMDGTFEGAGDFGGYVENSGGAGYGEYDNYEDYRKNQIYTTGKKQNPNFNDEKKRLLAWRVSKEFSNNNRHKCGGYTPSFDDRNKGSKTGGFNWGMDKEWRDELTKKVLQLYPKIDSDGDGADNWIGDGGWMPFHYYIHHNGPNGFYTSVDGGEGTFISNIRKWKKDPQYSLLKSIQIDPGYQGSEVAGVNFSQNPCDYLEALGFTGKDAVACKDHYAEMGYWGGNAPGAKLWKKMQNKLKLVSGYQQVDEDGLVDGEIPETTLLDNLQFVAYVTCLDKLAKKTLPKSKNYKFNPKTNSYTIMSETEVIKRKEKEIEKWYPDEITPNATMELLPITSLDGFDFQVNKKFLKWMSEWDMSGAERVSNGPSFIEANFLNSIQMSKESIKYLESIFNAGIPYLNKFIEGINWMFEWCEENGWYCVETVSIIVSTGLFIVTIFVGSTLGVELVILFAGAITVLALWKQGKRGWALAIGILEGLGALRFIKMFRFNRIVKSELVMKDVLLWLDTPTAALYATMGPKVRFAIDFIKANKKTAANLLNNSKEITDIYTVIKQIKNAAQFNLIQTTKNWQLIPDLRNIKTWLDFKNYKTFLDDLFNWQIRTQRTINTLVIVTKFTIGLGLPGFGAYLTAKRWNELFDEKQKKALEIALGLGNTGAIFPTKEEHRECMFLAMVTKLNSGCNSEWNAMLESVAGDYIESTTNEDRFNYYVQDLMDRKGTDDVTEVYDSIYATIQGYIYGADSCTDGDALTTMIGDCGLAKTSQRIFDAEEIATDLFDLMDGDMSDDDEIMFLAITSTLTSLDKLKVRKEFKDMGECLCDLIETKWNWDEKKVLVIWEMWEPDKTKGINLFNNCTCYNTNTKSIIPTG